MASNSNGSKSAQAARENLNEIMKEVHNCDALRSEAHRKVEATMRDRAEADASGATHAVAVLDDALASLGRTLENLDKMDGKLQKKRTECERQLRALEAEESAKQSKKNDNGWGLFRRRTEGN